MYKLQIFLRIKLIVIVNLSWEMVLHGSLLWVVHVLNNIWKIVNYVWMQMFLLSCWYMYILWTFTLANSHPVQESHTLPKRSLRRPAIPHSSLSPPPTSSPSGWAKVKSKNITTFLYRWDRIQICFIIFTDLFHFLSIL